MGDLGSLVFLLRLRILLAFRFDQGHFLLKFRNTSVFLDDGASEFLVSSLGRSPCDMLRILEETAITFGLSFIPATDRVTMLIPEVSRTRRTFPYACLTLAVRNYAKNVGIGVNNNAGFRMTTSYDEIKSLR